MKKLNHVQRENLLGWIASIFVLPMMLGALAALSFACPKTNNDAVSGIISVAISMVCLFFFINSARRSMDLERDEIGGVLASIFLQCANVYCTIAGKTYGFWVLRTIIPTTIALALFGALMFPIWIRPLIRTIKRRRLLRERIKLQQALLTLESKFSYREAPLEYGKLQARLYEVNTRLTELNA